MNPRFLAAGDTALTVELGDRAELGLSLKVLGLYRQIMAANLPGVVEVVPTLRSLMVHYDPCETSAMMLEALLLPMALSIGSESEGEEAFEGPPPARRWLIPACYAPQHGPDIEAVAAACRLEPWQVTALHACVAYRVLMVGFLPGHPYIGDLPPPLHVPRRATPRTSVPPGSIAIATSMCVIYPQNSPGGWHIIARTPVRLFDPGRAEPSLLGPGDEIRFRPIDAQELAELEAAAARGAWSLAPEEVAA